MNEPCPSPGKTNVHAHTLTCSYTYMLIHLHAHTLTCSYTFPGRDMGSIVRLNESCHIWMSYVTYEWVMSHMNESCQMSHVTEQYSQFVSYEWVMSNMNEPCPSPGKCMSMYVCLLSVWACTFVCESMTYKEVILVLIIGLFCGKWPTKRLSLFACEGIYLFSKVGGYSCDYICM